MTCIQPRTCSPDNIRYLWTAIQSQKHTPVTASKILKYMITDGEYMPDEADDVLQDAILDGLLVPVANTPSELPRSSKIIKDSNLYRIPDINEIKINDAEHDLYCFECHKPGDLHNCINCLRAFHIGCKRNKLDIPNDVLMMITNNYQGVDGEPDLNDSQNDIDNSQNDITGNDSLNQSDSNVIEPVVIPAPVEEEIINIRQSSVDYKPNMKLETQDTKELSDVICIGQIRSPRRRKSISIPYKNESVAADDPIEASSNSSMCTCCRLLENDLISDPPNISPDEISYLLKFTFVRIASWLSNDTFSPIPQSKSLPLPGAKSELDLLRKMCFKIPTTLDSIKQKLKDKEYKNLTEFLVDFLDIQHCIGILYGTASAEFEATKYQLSDCSYELSEIRQCRDCYRHSNEKLSDDWFCKPCVPRHELVYAKQGRYPYWPAKVIKFKSNKYDVRFFGGAHGRAIISSKYVKPIDSDFKQMKMSVTLRKAMDELQTHQAYNLEPPGYFSYEAERAIDGQIEMNIDVQQSQPTTLKRKSKSNKKLIRRVMKSSPINAWNQLSEVELTTSSKSNKKKRKSDSGGGAGDTEHRNKRGRPKKKTATESQANNSNLDKSKNNTDLNISANNTNGGKIVSVSLSPESHSKDAADNLVQTDPETDYFLPVSKLAVDMESAESREIAQKLALETLQAEINHWKSKVDILNQEIVEVKRNSWCSWCLNSSMYHCCWNNSYCSLECQNRHWQSEHKKTCKRVRNAST